MDDLKVIRFVAMKFINMQTIMPSPGRKAHFSAQGLIQQRIKLYKRTVFQQSHLTAGNLALRDEARTLELCPDECAEQTTRRSRLRWA
jgi:hypothetical protein